MREKSRNSVILAVPKPKKTPKPPKKRPKKPTLGQLKRTLDRLAREIVRARDKMACRICGGTDHLSAHHYFTRRSHAAVRWDTDNMLLICSPCHFRIHNRGDEEVVRDALLRTIGPERFEAMKARAWDRLDIRVPVLNGLIEGLEGQKKGEPKLPDS